MSKFEKDPNGLAINEPIWIDTGGVNYYKRAYAGNNKFFVQYDDGIYRNSFNPIGTLSLRNVVWYTREDKAIMKIAGNKKFIN